MIRPKPAREATANRPLVVGIASRRSPSSRPATTIIAPPHSICAAAPMNGDGRSRHLLQTEPNAHATGATSSATTQVGEAVTERPALSRPEDRGGGKKGVGTGR